MTEVNQSKSGCVDLKNFKYRRPNQNKIEIGKIDLACIAPRWGFLRLETKDGQVGFGEFTYEGQTEQTVHLVRMLEDFIKENEIDLENIELLTEALKSKFFYCRDAMFWSAFAGIEIACMDIKGKNEGKPIHALLGGNVADRLQIYQWAGGDFWLNDPAGPAVREVEVLVKSGLKFIKLNACPPMQALDVDNAIEQAHFRMMQIREAVGPEIKLAFDFHGRVNKTNAVPLAKALAEADPFFIEEGLRPEFSFYFPELAEKTGLRIATGERVFEPEVFQALDEQGAVTIFQPDLIHIGGITRTREVAMMAKNSGKAIAPHCPMGPIAFMACVHAMANSSASAILECSKNIHYNQASTGKEDPFTVYLNNPQVLDFKDGHVEVPIGPGLGLDINWERVQEAVKDGFTWKEPCRVHGLTGRPLRW